MSYNNYTPKPNNPFARRASHSSDEQPADAIALHAQHEAHYRRKELSRKPLPPLPTLPPHKSEGKSRTNQDGAFPTIERPQRSERAHRPEKLETKTNYDRTQAATLTPPIRSPLERKPAMRRKVADNQEQTIRPGTANPPLEPPYAAGYFINPTRRGRPAGETLERPQRGSEVKTIKRDAEGRFDPATVRSVRESKARDPTTSLEPCPDGYVQNPPPSPPRPTATRTNSWRNIFTGSKEEKAKKQKADESSSTESRRTSYIVKAVRRASDSVAEKAKILAMHKQERDEWTDKKRGSRRPSDEREENRRSKPSDRPMYQKAAILEKNKHKTNIVGNTQDVDRDYDVMVETSAWKTKCNEDTRRKYAKACEEADREGLPRPASPAYTEEADLEISAEEREALRLQAAEDFTVDKHLKPKALPIMTAAAVVLSVALDPLKPRKRGDSQTSQMSFADAGLSDADANMAERYFESCSQCHLPPTSFLTKSGECPTCHDERKMEEEEQRKGESKISLFKGDSKQIHLRTTDLTGSSAGRLTEADNTEQDSPPFMRVAASHKLRKVRQTIYEDPGNPFTTTPPSDTEVSLFSIPFHQPTFTNEQGEPELKLPRDRQLLTGSPFDDAIESPLVPRVPNSDLTFVTTLHAPIPQRQITAAMVKKAHRSTSIVAVPEDADEYVPARAGWRRGSVPVQRPAKDERKEKRDTIFYRFWDDLLPDYGQRRDSKL
ncbi:hypothetical protein LTR56_010895 [Elasticomyces elasticus]|nr:hypothetical protein LTR56_010895 [Elasticomyces elasticus]KAK5768250.1 hypothetical protein LTS12_001389 [Elasticomyces elasticus]